MPRASTPRIAAVGLASWDTFLVVGAYPAAGSFAIVDRTAALPGGTTANSAVTLARLGARLSLASVVGDDAPGRSIHAALEREGINLDWLGVKSGMPTDAATVIVSQRPLERTIYWRKGARLARGDRLDIGRIFDHDLVLVDTDDLPLRRFLVDLPAHTAPAARLLGTMTYLAPMQSADALAVALAHDALVGNERELCQITGISSLDAAIIHLQERMRTTNLRACAVSRGAGGATVFTSRERWDLPAFPVEVVDPTGAGDAFTGGVAYGMALRWDWPRTVRFACAVAALSTRSLGAQTALPTRAEVASLLGETPATLMS